MGSNPIRATSLGVIGLSAGSPFLADDARRARDDRRFAQKATTLAELLRDPFLPQNLT